MLWHTHSSSYFTPTSIVHLTKKEIECLGGESWRWEKREFYEQRRNYCHSPGKNVIGQVTTSLLNQLCQAVKNDGLQLLNKNNAEHHHASVYNQTIPDPPFPDAGMTYSMCPLTSMSYCSVLHDHFFLLWRSNVPLSFDYSKNINVGQFL